MKAVCIFADQRCTNVIFKKVKAESETEKKRPSKRSAANKDSE